MRHMNMWVLVCCGLAGCSAIDDGFEQVKRLATGLERIETGFADPAELYGEMSDGDVELAVAAMRVALETKATAQSVAWTNDTTGNQGRLHHFGPSLPIAVCFAATMTSA